MGPRPKRGTAHATGGGGAATPFAAPTCEARQFASSSARQQAEIFTRVFIDASFSHGLACDGFGGRHGPRHAALQSECRLHATRRSDLVAEKDAREASTNPPDGAFPPVGPRPELTLSRPFH